MNLIVVSDPVELPWQTSLCDLMLLTMFVAVVLYSVMQFRCGIQSLPGANGTCVDQHGGGGI